MKKTKLLLAGSHAGATAIAVVQEIQKQNLAWEISWVGKKWATEDKSLFTLEYNHLSKLGVNFFELESGRLQTKFTKYTVSALLKVPFGFLKAAYLISKIQPDVILTFGGAAGAEIAFWGFIFGIPVIVHEQTSAAGRANIFASKFAKEVAISRDSSKKFFKNSKLVLTGNPINQQILLARPSLTKSPGKLFITGGSRGSERINKALVEILPKLLKKFKVVWQIGEANLGKYNIADKNLRVYGQLEPSAWAKEIIDSDIVISRSGSNVVSELIALKKPSILIPIPWAYADEQTENAKLAREFGIGVILPQDELTPMRLMAEIDRLCENYEKITQNIKNKISPDIKASINLINIIKRYA